MDIQQLMAQAQKMQQTLSKAQEELKTKEYTGKQGDAVKVVITGSYEVKSVEIAEDLMDKDSREMLQDMLTVAFNDAARQVKEDREKTLGYAADGMDLPNL